MKKLVKNTKKSLNEVSLYCKENPTQDIYVAYNVLGQLDHVHIRGCKCANPKSITYIEVPYRSGGAYCGFDLYPGSKKSESERLCAKDLLVLGR